MSPLFNIVSTIYLRLVKLLSIIFHLLPQPLSLYNQ